MRDRLVGAAVAAVVMFGAGVVLVTTGVFGWSATSERVVPVQTVAPPSAKSSPSTVPLASPKPRTVAWPREFLNDVRADNSDWVTTPDDLVLQFGTTVCGMIGDGLKFNKPAWEVRDDTYRSLISVANATALQAAHFMNAATRWLCPQYEKAMSS
jgi:hypothetical protein